MPSLSTSSSFDISVVTDPLAVSCVCPANQRSLFDILWSCLATIFACTWVSVHPNIPHPNATKWSLVRHRLHLMFWAIIAPELLVLWAMRQWHGARRLAELLKDLGWTKTHGHFAQMGGFMLVHGDVRIKVMSPDAISQLLRRGIFSYNNQIIDKKDIQFPTLVEEEIQDKSKGDALSKALVIVQTSWFVAQCISRWAQALVVTELELITLAFAALNAVVYFLWWNKPQDVRYGVSVCILKEILRVEFIENANTEGSEIESPEPQETWVSILAPPTADKDSEVLQNPLNLGPPDSSASMSNRLKNLIQDAVSRITLAVLRNATGLRALFRLSTWARLHGWVLTLRDRYMYQYTQHGDNLEVSLLYAHTLAAADLSIIAATSAIAVSFGAIHCGGWNFPFPSRPEKLLWRAWASIITIVPLVLLARSSARYYGHKYGPMDGPWEYSDNIGPRITFYVVLFLIPGYVVARLGLLGEAFIALRDLQPGARAQVEWTNFLPHI